MTPAERMADALRRQRDGIKQHLMDRWDEITQEERSTLTKRATHGLDAAFVVDEVQSLLLAHDSEITTDDGPDEFGAYAFDADTRWFCGKCDVSIGTGDRPEEVIKRHQAEVLRAHLLNEPIPNHDDENEDH